MTVNHIDDLEFFFVKLVGAGSAAVFDRNHIETFIRQAADG
jgi:hypothetical protein